MCDVADSHFALIGERNSDNVLSIQVFVDHAAAHGISVQADQKVEQRARSRTRMFFFRSDAEKISSEK